MPQRRTRRFSFFILLAMTLGLSSACTRQEKNSIIVIAIDDLPGTDFSCSRDSASEDQSGLDLLCQEAVRFTHAYTTSPLVVPSLASILTAQYPFQHRLRHNGQSLDPRAITVAETALGKGYRTAFFSGGPPVLRKTGLHQGFETFDDGFVPNLKALHRPFQKSAQQFDQWVRHEVEDSSFFAFFYVPDLMFINTETVSETGETRNLSYESQVEELNNSLYRFFQNLKNNNRWDQTTIVLAGLNGNTNSDRPGEISALNLHGENTQVILLIKPAQKKRDEGITWKVDTNVSLADVGATLFDLLGSYKRAANEDFAIESLKPLLSSSENYLSEDRPILVESAWGEWKSLSNIRAAILRNHVLYINDSAPRIYNTLVDRMETSSLPAFESNRLSAFSLRDLFAKNDFHPWSGLSPLWKNKLGISMNRWLKSSQRDLLIQDLKAIVKKYPEDKESAGWLAYTLLENKDWPALRDFGKKLKQPLWLYVAEKNMGVAKAAPSDPCFDLLQVKTLDSQQMKKCDDELFLDFVDWRRSDERGLSKDAQKVKFENAYRHHKIDTFILRSNLALNSIWDTPAQIRYAPTTMDLILYLPENQKVRLQLEKLVQANVEQSL